MFFLQPSNDILIKSSTLSSKKIFSQERQAAYNKTFGDSSGQNKDTVLEKLVLDFDPETKKVLVEVNPKLVKKLKPHQVQMTFSCE